MKAKHTVKINGEWYRVGSEIPTQNHKEPEKVVVESVATPEDEKLTKSKIMLMNVAGLRELGVKHGIDNVEELTGSELKEMLIGKLGL